MKFKFCVLAITSVALLLFDLTSALAKEGADTSCKKWFLRSGLKSTNKDCRQECSILLTDLGTFHCPGQCEFLCDDPCKTARDFWSSLLRKGAPPNWPNAKEKSVILTANDHKKLISALLKLPEPLRIKSVAGIFRMDKSKDFPNPATHAEHVIVLYDTAFTGGQKLERVLAHELAHEMFDALSEEKVDSYKLATNWFEIKSSEKGGKTDVIRRKDGFVSEDGKASVEEDFANNIEFFLFDQPRLKSVTPQAHSWILTHFGDKFKVGGSCE